ncbi:hypothetical protein D3C77_559660 [compost metagenome]
MLSGKPNPRKDNPDSRPILAARFKVIVTIIIELKLGITWVNIIFKCDEPSVLEALTYSSSLSCSVLERMRRAIPIHRKEVMIRENDTMLYLGTAATNAITIISVGRIIKKSTTRIDMLSTVPPK